MSIWSLTYQWCVFKRRHGNKHFWEFYPQNGGETSWHRYGLKLRHCHGLYIIFCLPVCCSAPLANKCVHDRELSSLQHVKLWSTCFLFRRSLRLELTSWAYPAININSCLQALTKDISTPADIAPSALETVIFYCFIGYISALAYYLLNGKGSPYSITERSVPELIPVLGSQPAGGLSHKPGITFRQACSYPRNP